MVGQTRGPQRPDAAPPAEHPPPETQKTPKKPQVCPKKTANSQVLSLTPDAKRNDGQPNFMTMQQKLSEKLLANQQSVGRLPEQQFILKNHNYFTMVTNKSQSNFVNYVPIPASQQNFIAVDQPPKNSFVVTVPQKPPSPAPTYLVHGNGPDLKSFNSYLAVTTKPGDTNGTAFFTMTPTKSYLMAKQPENSRTAYLALPTNKSSENNNTATFITMEPKPEGNIIVLPSSQLPQPSQHAVFQLEYADAEKNVAANGKFYTRDAVAKMSSATSSVSVASAPKTVMTNPVPPLSVATNKRAAMSPPLAAAASYIASSGSVTFLPTSAPPNVQSLASSNMATLVTNSSRDEVEVQPQEKKESSAVPHSHQYLIPNVDSFKMAADTINKPPQPAVVSSSKPMPKPQSPELMHNYSKHELSGHLNHVAKHESSRRKYEGGKPTPKYSHSVYANQGQGYGSMKARFPEARPTNHQRLDRDRLEAMVKLESMVKPEPKVEYGEAEEGQEDEGVEVRPTFDESMPLLFQVVMADHAYNLPPELLSEVKPAVAEDDKESVISSDEKGDEGEETETAPEGEDGEHHGDSITRCICDLMHDDGYMVCCDKCYVWQHVACVFPDVRPGTPLPDEYLCDACRPRKLDRNRARAHQLQRRKLFTNSDSSDSSSSSMEMAPRPPKKPMARRRAEPVPRKPGKLKPDLLGLSLSDEAESKRHKPLPPKVRRRRSSPLPPPPLPPVVSSVGRRTKLKKKLESKIRPLRRKNKLRDLKELGLRVADKDRMGAAPGRQKNSPREAKDECGRVLSPDLKIRVQLLKCTNPGDHISLKSVNKVRCRLSRLTHAEPVVVASCSLCPGQPIIEVRGRLLLYTDHPARSESMVTYRFPKDGSEILIDTSDKENVVKYARRSCRPNAQVKHFVTKGTLRLYLVATGQVEKNQELTIPVDSVPDGLANLCTVRRVCLCRTRECPFASVERRRRGRRRTASEESDSSPSKPVVASVNRSRQQQMAESRERERAREREREKEREKEREREREREREQNSAAAAKAGGGSANYAEPQRRHSSMTQSSRSPTSPGLSDTQQTPTKDKDKDKDRKLTRDERKIEQAMKLFAQMERETARKKDKDRPTSLSSSREIPATTLAPRSATPRDDSRCKTAPPTAIDSDKESLADSGKPRRRRRRRRRRSRKMRLSSGASTSAHTQPNSGDSDLSSGDEIVSPRRKRMSKDSRDDIQSPGTSPVDKASPPALRGRMSRRDSMTKVDADTMKQAAGLLLALGRPNPYSAPKTPTRGDKESEGDVSSPPTPMSSACLLVAAAVGPLAPEFRFPKTKKGLMNEWLSKSPEHPPLLDYSPGCEAPPHSSQLSLPPLPPGAPKLSNLSTRLFSLPVDSKQPTESLTLRDRPDSLPIDPRLPSGTPAGFGKKRWLRQAISEECETPQGQSSPPCPPENVTPLKKRRLARESLSSDPPTTPPTLQQTGGPLAKEDRVYAGEPNSPESPGVVDTSDLTERVDALRREYLGVHENNEEHKPLDLTGQATVIVMAEGKRKPKPKLNKLRTSPRARRIAKPKKPENNSNDNQVEVISYAGKDEPDLVEEKAIVTEIRPESVKSEEDSGLGLKTNEESKDSMDVEVRGVQEVSESQIKEETVAEEVKTEEQPSMEEVKVKEEEIAQVHELKCEQMDETVADAPLKVDDLEIVKKDDESEVSEENERSRAEEMEVDVAEEVGLDAGAQEDVPEEMQAEQSGTESEHMTPIKRKLSITEYLKRKKTSQTRRRREGSPLCCGDEGMVTPPSPGKPSPISDDERSIVSMTTPTLPPIFFDLPAPVDKPGSGGRFKSEPTELERQRENLTERLRREFGLLISDDEAKPPEPNPAPPPAVEEAEDEDEDEDDMPPPPPPPLPPPAYLPSHHRLHETNGYHQQSLPQSAIYPVGSSNPPNPATCFPPPPPPPPHHRPNKDRRPRKLRGK